MNESASEWHGVALILCRPSSAARVAVAAAVNIGSGKKCRASFVLEVNLN